MSAMSMSSAVPAVSAGRGLARFSLARIVLGTLMVVLPVALTMFLAHQLVPKPWRSLWPQLLAAALCVGAYLLYMRKVERRAPDAFAMAGAGRELGAGLLLGGGLFTAAIAVLAVAGCYRVSGVNGWSVLAGPFAEIALVALVEEIVFRAILLRNLERSLGSTAAVVISALIFGLAHLPNDNLTFVAIAVTVAAGTMLAAAYLATRRLWLVVGLHFGWNFSSDAIFSVATSGHPAKGILQGRTSGPVWLSGGDYGVEGSLLALVLIALAALALLVVAYRRGNMVSRRAARTGACA